MDIHDIIGLTEFRSNFKLYFDTAKRNAIYIRRDNDVFKLTQLPARITYSEDHPDKPADQKPGDWRTEPTTAEPITADFFTEPKLTPVTVMGTPADTFVTQDVKPTWGEKPCCANERKQCVHWTWQDDGTLVNALSGRSKAVSPF